MKITLLLGSLVLASTQAKADLRQDMMDDGFRANEAFSPTSPPSNRLCRYMPLGYGRTTPPVLTSIAPNAGCSRTLRTCNFLLQCQHPGGQPYETSAACLTNNSGQSDACIGSLECEGRKTAGHVSGTDPARSSYVAVNNEHHVDGPAITDSGSGIECRYEGADNDPVSPTVVAAPASGACTAVRLCTFSVLCRAHVDAGQPEQRGNHSSISCFAKSDGSCPKLAECASQDEGGRLTTGMAHSIQPLRHAPPVVTPGAKTGL